MRSEAHRDLSMAKGHFVFVGEGDARIVAGSMGRAERLAPLSFHGGSTHVRVHATKRYYLSRTHRRIVLASRQKQPVNVHVHAETFIQLRSSRGTSRGKKGNRRPRLRLAKWINDRRTREKRVVDREGLDIVRYSAYIARPPR